MGKSPVYSHHVGVGDETHPRKLFGILNSQIAEVGDPRHLIGYMVCANGKDDEGLAIGVQARCGSLIINNMVSSIGGTRHIDFFC